MHPTFLIIPYRKCELLQSEMIKPKSSSVWQNSTSRTTYPSKFKSRTSREAPSSSFFLVPKGIPSTRIATKPRRLPISSMANWGDAGEREQLYCECRKLQSLSAEDSRGGSWVNGSQTPADAGHRVSPRPRLSTALAYLSQHARLTHLCRLSL